MFSARSEDVVLRRRQLRDEQAKGGDLDVEFSQIVELEASNTAGKLEL